MTKVAVLNDYQNVALSSADWSEAEALAEIEVFYTALDEDAAVAALGEFEVLCVMRERLPLGASLFERLPNLRGVVTTGEFNRAIDLEAAARNGVVVSGTTNGVGRIVTAELTWGLILAAARHLPAEERAIAAGDWQTTLGTGLHGKTLGIIGLGAIGRYIARYGRAFGMEVLAWSRNLTDEAAMVDQATRVDKDELLARSDFVSLHMVLSEQTTGLIDADALAKMKPSAIIVNTSRGPLIDEGALIAALRAGEIGGAALDVFDHEPLPADHPFRELGDRVVLSPHIGYVTDEVYDDFFNETVRSLVAFLRGEPIRVLNPDALTTA
jgi:phosphoglycerate dehydrogenase-like enzyme